MKLRNETIEKINRYLNEDIGEQFIANELDAVMNGKDYFYVHNKGGHVFKINIIYYELGDVLDYHLMKFQFKMNTK